MSWCAKEGLEKARNKCAAELLLQVMSDISEDNWSAGWLCDLEYLLWLDLDAPFPRTLTVDQVNKLKWLRDEARGWWTWRDVEEVGNYDKVGNYFVTPKEWMARLEQNSARVEQLKKWAEEAE